MSAIRPAVAVLCLTLIGAATYAWNQDRLLTADANRHIDAFGGRGEADAVLLVWRAPEPLRRRVYDLVHANDDRLERALLSQWPLAHAGFESAGVRQAASVLRPLLEQERKGRIVGIYAAVAARLSDPADVKAEATALRARLEQARDPRFARHLAEPYAAVAARRSDPADVKAEATALRARLEQERDGWIASSFAQAYAAVAARLSDPADAEAAATALRARLEQERNGGIASSFAQAYAAVAGAMIERADTQGRSALALELLTLAGHPFVTKPDFLLDALQPAAGVDFGDNVGAAVRWAAETYGIRPDQLRPPPLPR